MEDAGGVEVLGMMGEGEAGDEAEEEVVSSVGIRQSNTRAKWLSNRQLLRRRCQKHSLLLPLPLSLRRTRPQDRRKTSVHPPLHQPSEATVEPRAAHRNLA